MAAIMPTTRASISVARNNRVIGPSFAIAGEEFVSIVTLIFGCLPSSTAPGIDVLLLVFERPRHPGR
jgi:hypothetical protein